ncbi:MAG: O-antigen ligase family protein [Deltaproteobacteria bacterium]|nr:O-antigen ligase family protein [Deltaproteobacteria bacterium]
MQISVSKTGPVEWWLLVAGGLCLGLFVTAVSIYFPSTIMPGLEKQVIPSLVIFALLVGFLIVLKPEAGVILMFAMLLFKPESLQGLGVVTILKVALGALFLTTVALRKELSFLKVSQVQILFLLALVSFFNWMLLGQVEAPSYLSDLAMFLTLPGAISHSTEEVRAAEKLRAVATAGIQAAENANRLAFLSLMGIALIWFALLEYKKKLLWIFGAPAILALIFTVFLGASRSGRLNLGLLPLLLLAQSGLRKGKLAAIALLLVLAVSVTLLFVPERIFQRITSFSLTSESAHVSGATLSLQRRVQILQTGLKFFGEHPFMGVGVGNFRWMTAMDSTFGGLSGAAHNAYLLALAEGGMILLLVYLLLFWRTYKDLGKALKRAALAPDVRLRWLVLATRTNLVLLLVFSLFAEAWKEFYYVLILGTAAVLTQLYQRAVEKSWSQSRSST